MEKKIREKEIFRKTITSDTEEVYEFVKYESDDYYRIISENMEKDEVQVYITLAYLIWKKI